MSEVPSDNIPIIQSIACFMYIFQMQLLLTQEKKYIYIGHWNDKVKELSALQITTAVEILWQNINNCVKNCS
jgi:hypothetical protein